MLNGARCADDRQTSTPVAVIGAVSSTASHPFFSEEQLLRAHWFVDVRQGRDLGPRSEMIGALSAARISNERWSAHRRRRVDETT